ncbi:MAG: M24 family metallopeptidase [Candidatus Omnitrophica bacterium]|nr:M24 family metallopeptidase [Candidatus Omnitrophota bacterium]
MKRIEKAAKLAAEIFREIAKYIKPGISEMALAEKIESRIKTRGLKRSFRTIVASGSNAAKPHAALTQRRIRHRDVVVVDFGVVYRGERSDMTRTVFVGTPNALMKRMLRAVRGAQLMAIRAVKPGIRISYLAKKAHDFLRKKGFGRNILHSLGHGIGKKVHESPKLSEKNRNILKKGMVITIEPGLYVKGKGGVRIEDMLLVTQNSGRILTQ